MCNCQFIFSEQNVEIPYEYCLYCALSHIGQFHKSGDGLYFSDVKLPILALNFSEEVFMFIQTHQKSAEMNLIFKRGAFRLDCVPIQFVGLKQIIPISFEM